LKAEIKVIWFKEKGYIEYRFSNLSYHFIKFLQGWVDLLGEIYKFDKVETFQEADTFIARFYADEGVIRIMLGIIDVARYPIETK